MSGAQARESSNLSIRTLAGHWTVPVPPAALTRPRAEQILLYTLPMSGVVLARS